MTAQVRDIAKALYSIGVAGSALVVWWFAGYLLSLAADEPGEPHWDVFSPIVLAPLLVLFVGLAITAVSVPPRWRVWRWVPLAALLSNGVTIATLGSRPESEWSLPNAWPYLWWAALVAAVWGTWLARPRS